MAISSTFDRGYAARTTPRLDVPAVFAASAFAIGDYGVLTLFRGVMLGDVLIMVACLLLLLDADRPRLPAWYWASALAFAAGTCLSLFPAATVTAGGWALHSYFYLALVPLASVICSRNYRACVALAFIALIPQAVVGAELLWRVVAGHLVWSVGPTVPTITGVTNPMLFVIAIVFGFSLLAIEWTGPRRVWMAAVIVISLAANGAAVVLTHKRTSWAELLVAGLVLLAVLPRRARGVLGAYGAVAVIVLLLAAAMPPVVRDRLTGAIRAITGTELVADSSYSARQLAANRVLRGFFDGPWTNLLVGYGYRESPRYVGSDLVVSSTGGAHNAFINYLVETGLAGVVPLGALWTGLAWLAGSRFRAARRAFHESRDPRTRTIALLFVACCAAVSALWVELLFAPDIFLREAFLVYGMTLGLAPALER